LGAILLDPDSTTATFILTALLFIHAFFAAAKEAMIYVRKSRRLQLIEEGNQTARLLDTLAEDIPLLLATEQLFLKFFGFFLVSLAVYVYTPLLAETLATSPPIAFCLIILAAVLTVVTLGELLPREIGRAYAEPIALAVTPPFNLLAYAALPLARVTTLLGRLLTGRWNGTDSPPTITEEDLLTYVDAGEEEGVLEESERKMIYSIFELADTVAREIMLPRIDVVAIEVKASITDALEVILKAGHSRLPVYTESLDNIVGILYAKDLLTHWHEEGEPCSVQGLMREVFYVPESKPVSDLLREMQARKVHIAVIVDEYGGTAGIVTIEDILEEIVGEIHDEYDAEEFSMERISDDEFIFNARLDLDDINHIMAVNLPTDESDTLGGLIYTCLGRVPEVGDALDLNDLHLVVLEVDGRRINRAKIERVKKSEGGEPEEKPAEEKVAAPPELVGTNSSSTVS
jgi:CBS domain containing-hemolysin-like protein